MPFPIVFKTVFFTMAMASPAALAPRTVTPAVASSQEVGLVYDIQMNRDSCTSTRVGTREFWTCRDSTNYGSTFEFLFTSSASWTNFNSDGTPDVTNEQLLTYPNNTQLYFPAGSVECPPTTACPNNSGRWPLWPDSPPLPVNNGSGLSLYTWIKNVHFNSSGDADNGNPPTSLYRTDWDGSTSDDLPPVTLVNEYFYPANAIPFGDYGWVVSPSDGFAYLYGLNSAGTVLARVDPTKIEDITQYAYYSEATGWTGANGTPPAFDDTSAPIPNCGTGQQGTFYYSSYFGQFVWIGGQAPDDATFQISTATQPWGPWSTPTTFYVGTPGTSFNGYSWQAHPGLSSDGGNGKDIYLTFTRVNDVYENALIYIQWQ